MCVDGIETTCVDNDNKKESRKLMEDGDGVPTQRVVSEDISSGQIGSNKRRRLCHCGSRQCAGYLPCLQ